MNGALESAGNENSLGRPWGLWATLGFSLVIAVVAFVVMVVVTVMYVALAPTNQQSPAGEVHANFDTKVRNLAESLQSQGIGTLVAIVILSGATAVSAACIACAALRRGISVQSYLGLRAVPCRQLICWIAVAVLFAVASDTLTAIVGRPIVSESTIRLYRSVVFKPLLWIAYVVGVPQYQEFYFRGFLFAGIRYSWLGSVGAVLLTAAAGAALVVPDGLYGISTVFIWGLVLGYARIRSGTLMVPLTMQGIMNLVSVLEAAFYVHFQQ
jgi:uncharacterized protein